MTRSLRSLRTQIAGALIFVTFSCSGQDTTSSRQHEIARADGIWNGYFSTSTGVKVSVGLKLEVTGNDVTGEYWTGDGNRGKITGIVSGAQRLTLNAKQTTALTCPAEYRIHLLVSGRASTLTYRGHSCNGAENGVGRLKR